MRAQEYVEAFPRILPAYEADLVRPWNVNDERERSLGWSYLFGKVLHDHMRGVDSDAFTQKDEAMLYKQWNLSTAEAHASPFHVTAEDAEHRNTANFHALNRNLDVFWDNILPPSARVSRLPAFNNRQFVLRFAQQALAYEAVEYMVDRHFYIEEAGGTHALFQTKNLKNGRVKRNGGFTEVVGSGQGIIEEFDEAIVAIEALLRFPDLLGHNTLLLPAPVQFERSNYATNVDLIFYDPTSGGRAVGLQATTSVTKKNVADTDPDRVVLIDGQVDFNSVRPVRTDKGKSHEEVVSWPGMIAAQVVSEFILTGKRPSACVAVNIDPITLSQNSKKPLNHRTIIAARVAALRPFRQAMENAKLLMGGTKVDMALLSKRMAERVAPKL